MAFSYLCISIGFMMFVSQLIAVLFYYNMLLIP